MAMMAEHPFTSSHVVTSTEALCAAVSNLVVSQTDSYYDGYRGGIN